jgi:hypothetical protein
MRKEDHIRRIMNLYKEVEDQSGGADVRIDRITDKPNYNWDELVEFAADQGIDNLELQDLVRMADLAKDILKSRTY